MIELETVIGLEIHVQLLTNSKIFCSCPTTFAAKPNTNTCPVCLGHPGALPVLNKAALRHILRMGIATNCIINQHSNFARKNYFYPDLPKGYQISQFDKSFCENGFLRLGNTVNGKIIIKERSHLEEDAGKLIHSSSGNSYVDLNRAGVPLMELVTEPDISSPEEANQFMQKIRQLVRYLGIGDGNMEEGSLRCDANVSLRKKGEQKLGTKTEIKNLKSFRFVEKALQNEIERQKEILNDGGVVVQQTLLWNADLGEVVPMRDKEDSHDYRYFSDPDLLPVILSNEELQTIKTTLPPLPEEVIKRLQEEFQLPEYDASIIAEEAEVADYYFSCARFTKDYKGLSNFIMTEIFRILKERKISIKMFTVSAENIGKLIELVREEKISIKTAKDIFPEMLKEDIDPSILVQEKGLLQISDQDSIRKIINEVIEQNMNMVSEYIGGKEKVFGSFVGKVMKASNGKANPKLVNEILLNELNKHKIN